MHVRWFRCLGGIFGSCVRCSRSASRQLVRVSAFHGKWPIPNIWDIKWHEVTSSDMKYELVMEWDIKIHKVHVFWVGPVQTLASGSLAILWPCQVHVQKKVDKILRQDTGYIVNIIYIWLYMYIYMICILLYINMLWTSDSFWCFWHHNQCCVSWRPTQRIDSVILASAIATSSAACTFCRSCKVLVNSKDS